jgi:hypothetical protein
MSSDSTMATGLQRFDLDIVIGARIGVLDAQHPDRALAPDDRHAGEGVKHVFAGFGAVGEFRVTGRFVEIQDGDMFRDGADQAFAHGELGHVHGALVQAQRREQLQHPVAQQVDRADLALQRFGDDLDDLVELGLCVRPRRHHVVQPGQDLASGGGRGGRHGSPLTERAPLEHGELGTSGRDAAFRLRHDCSLQGEGHVLTQLGLGPLAGRADGLAAAGHRRACHPAHCLPAGPRRQMGHLEAGRPDAGAEEAL